VECAGGQTLIGRPLFYCRARFSKLVESEKPA
jgi:hypothetical protein